MQKCKRDAILDEAKTLFHMKGFAAVGTTEICEKASINRGTLYHFFPSKNNLFLACLDAYVESLRQTIMGVTAGKCSSRRKLSKLFGLVSNSIAEQVKNAGFYKGCFLANSLETCGHEEVRAALISHSERLIMTIEPIVVGLKNEENLAEISSRRGAEIIYSIWQSSVHLGRLYQDAKRVGDMEEVALAALTSKCML